MKVTVFLLTILICFFSTLNVEASEGATVVGDGGLVVKCGEEITLLDLFEKEVLLGSKKISLSQTEQSSIQEMVQEGIDRIKNRFPLAERELQKLERAAEEFLRLPLFDPWKQHIGRSNNYLFSKPPQATMDKRVYEEILRKKCEIGTVVIRPSRDSKVVDAHRSVCSRSVSTFENCFYVNKTIYKKMSKEQRACLIIHEISRYLPNDLLPEDERILREMVADICTEQTATE